MSRTLGDVGGQTSNSSAWTDAGENFAKEFRRSVLFLLRSRRFLFVADDWGKQLQYRTVAWAGSSSSSACFGDEKKPMALRGALLAGCVGVSVLPRVERSRGQPGGCADAFKASARVPAAPPYELRQLQNTALPKLNRECGCRLTLLLPLPRPPRPGFVCRERSPRRLSTPGATGPQTSSNFSYP